VVRGVIRGQSKNDADTLDTPETQRVLHDRLLRTSIGYFAAEIIRGPIEEPYNGKFITCRHHLKWDKAIAQGHRKILAIAARDHSKSHFWSVAFPIWMGGYKAPGSLGYIFGASQTLAEEKLDLVKKEIVENPKLHWLIPASGERYWSKGEIRLSTGSVIRARGWGVRVRGGHPLWIVEDDVLDDTSLYSETKRRRAIDYHFSVPVNMVVPGGDLIAVGTPFHHGDLLAKIQQTGKYKCIVSPAIDRKGRILFPQRYDAKALQDKKEEIGPTRFAREFLCQALSDESSLFPAYLFDQPNCRQPYCLGIGWKYWEDKGWPRYTGVDLAFSAEIGSDYTVIFTIAVDDRGNRWIVNIRHGQGWSYDRQISEIEDEYALTRADSIAIESNQAQAVYGRNLVATTDLPIVSFITSGAEPKKPWRRGMTSVTAGKHNLDRGIPALRLGLERGKWRIPRGDEHSIDLTDRWMGELQCISLDGGRIVSAGEHDDLAMASWFCDYQAQRGTGIKMYLGSEEDGKHEQEEELRAPGPDEPEELDFFGINPEDSRNAKQGGEPEAEPAYDISALVGRR